MPVSREYDVWFGLVGLLALVVIRLITTLVHELGHAAVALRYGKDRVAIYVGSYGDASRSWLWKTGRLDIYIRRHPLWWNYGVCFPGSWDEVTPKRIFLLRAGGPLASLSLGVVALVVVLLLPESMLLTRSILGFVSLSFFYDFVYNILPGSRPIRLHSGDITHNDGYRLRQLLVQEIIRRQIVRVNKDRKAGNYRAAARRLDPWLRMTELEEGFQKLYLYVADNWMKAEEYRRAARIIRHYLRVAPGDPQRQAYAGFIASTLEQHEKALTHYNRAIEIDPEHVWARTNRGFEFLIAGKYVEAAEDFDRVIALQPSAYVYSNRGYARLKLGFAKEGANDLVTAMQLDDKEAYVYRSFGLQHLDEDRCETALQYFEKAAELNKNTYGIKQLIRETKTRVKQPSVPVRNSETITFAA